MKLECSGCSARYTIDDGIIPPTGAKIRCRKCGTVIEVPARGVAPRVEPAPTATPVVPASPALPPVSYTAPASQPMAPPAAPAPAFAAAPAPQGGAAGFSFLSNNGGEAASRSAAPAAAAPSAPPPPSPSLAASAAPVAVPAAVPEGLSAEEKSRHEKARRLARVLASDIAIYNREKKDRGLAEGNLVAVLGYEIKKSWEIYKERVGGDFANATPYFRDALNDLLAEGKKIF
jgi:predicted Zn finger-like uncharacterized protein